MNGILREILLLEAAEGGMTVAELDDFIESNYDVDDSVAFRVWLGFYDVKYFDDEQLMIEFILEGGDVVDDLVQQFNDSFEGCFDSVEAFSEWYFMDSLSIDTDSLHDTGVLNCVDWELYWSNQLQFKFYYSGKYFFRN